MQFWTLQEVNAVNIMRSLHFDLIMTLKVRSVLSTLLTFPVKGLLYGLYLCIMTIKMNLDPIYIWVCITKCSYKLCKILPLCSFFKVPFWVKYVILFPLQMLTFQQQKIVSVLKKKKAVSSRQHISQIKSWNTKFTW